MNPTNGGASTPTPCEVPRHIGTLLVEQGVLTPPELDRAFQVAAERRLDWGEVIVSLGILTEDQIAALIAEEFKVPYVFPYAGLIDRELLSHFPSELLLRYRAIPFAR